MSEPDNDNNPASADRTIGEGKPFTNVVFPAPAAPYTNSFTPLIPMSRVLCNLTAMYVPLVVVLPCLTTRIPVRLSGQSSIVKGIASQVGHDQRERTKKIWEG